ncbi:hypothetical protein BC936DRAFT_149785 [Jimgerdemannia flammicorona]|uniref:Chitin-binding type-1 domain-containing protein n=1 Tax=Jimgerdemannia flammicorona TaxID=994334 RepID=A0A433D054_9FUNG|nr:hypothetical protein BC936DRAFT_149785 [Jimgerdemannia flammicorona]
MDNLGSLIEFGIQPILLRMSDFRFSATAPFTPLIPFPHHTSHSFIMHAFLGTLATVLYIALSAHADNSTNVTSALPNTTINVNSALPSTTNVASAIPNTPNTTTTSTFPNTTNSFGPSFCGINGYWSSCGTGLCCKKSTGVCGQSLNYCRIDDCDPNYGVCDMMIPGTDNGSVSAPAGWINYSPNVCPNCTFDQMPGQHSAGTRGSFGDVVVYMLALGVGVAAMGLV